MKKHQFFSPREGVKVGSNEISFHENAKTPNFLSPYCTEGSFVFYKSKDFNYNYFSYLEPLTNTLEVDNVFHNCVNAMHSREWTFALDQLH